MDAVALLAILAVVVAIDTLATGVLVVLTVRDRRTGRRRGPVGEPGTPPAQPPVPGPSADPLAGAISAFLERREGLFRAPGPTAPATSWPPPSPEPGVWPPSAAAPIEGPPAVVRPVAVRPTRLVPAGPPTRYVAPGVAAEAPPRAPEEQPAGPPSHAALPAATPAVSAVRLTPSPSPSLPTPRYRPASELRVELVARLEPSSPASAAAVDRLTPVIGGLLRERTRARDLVADDGPGSFVVVLPDTPVDGADALGRRLVTTCDAWLGAESPALRLELAAADRPGGLPGAALEPVRVAGVERRRSLSRPD